MGDPIDKGTKVELLAGVEGVYKKAIAGAQGLVTDTRIDEGFPIVYVEWDREHFRYTGEDDCWTFAQHFQPIEPDIDLFEFLENPERFLEKIFARVKDEEDQDELIEGFIASLTKTLNVLADSDGFLVVATKIEADPTNPERSLVVPHVYSGFLSERAMAIIEAQVVQLAAMSHQEMALGILSQLGPPEDEEDDAEEQEDDDDDELEEGVA